MKKVRLLALAGLFVISTVHATLVRETFTNNPTLDGWQEFGDTNLFQWDSTNHVLDVTWDSTQTNSYFYHPLGRTYTKADSFCVRFDLNITDTAATNYFQLGAGLCNFTNATSTNFSRANGNSPNLFEFDYFPGGPKSYGPSIDATLVDGSDKFYFAYDDSQPMLDGVTYRIVLIHAAGASTISGVVYTNDQPFTKMPQIYGTGGATNDFQLDTLEVFNYTSTDDAYGDSLLAHGKIDDIAFASPLPVGLIRTTATGQAQFASDTNWLYTLEQSTNLQNWTTAAPVVFGNGTNLLLQATNPPTGRAFYRVRADLP